MTRRKRKKKEKKEVKTFAESVLRTQNFKSVFSANFMSVSSAGKMRVLSVGAALIREYLARSNAVPGRDEREEAEEEEEEEAANGFKLADDNAK